MHSHPHSHPHLGEPHNGGDPNQVRRRLEFSLALAASYMVVEFAGGLIFNSLALVADAGHMLSDVLALALSAFAMRLGARRPTDRFTFGLKRTEILAALINGIAIWGLVGVIFFEAVQRLLNPPEVRGVGMLVIAGIGLAVNVVMAGLLFSRRKENLNIRGAFLHIVGDALGSVGAIVAAVVIVFTNATWVDAAVSVLIGLLLIYSSWALIKESVTLLLEGVPIGMDIGSIERAIVEDESVCCVYDLHVWGITGERPSLSAHVILSRPDAPRDDVLERLNAILRERFNIDHITLQIESTHEMKSTPNGAYCRTGTACSWDPEHSG